MVKVLQIMAHSVIGIHITDTILAVVDCLVTTQFHQFQIDDEFLFLPFFPPQESISDEMKK